MGLPDPETMSLDALVAEVIYWRDVFGQSQKLTLASADFLTSLEEKIVRFLWKRRGFVVPRSLIIDGVWPPNVHIDERTVDGHMKDIRKKLKDHGWQGEIKARRGLGFYIAKDAPNPLEETEHDTSE